MKLPETLYFLRPGWWVVHLASPVAVFASGVALGIFHASGHGGHASPPSVTGNPLRDEMVDLQVAFDTLNRGILLGRTAGIEEAFHAVHARREATASALAAGTVHPPRNADRMDAFAARDHAFHALVESTVDAARRDDLPTLRVRSVEMFDACLGCHAEFRDPVDPAEHRLQEAKEAVPALGNELRARLEAAMSEGGPEAAVKVCAGEAQEITRRIASERDVAVGRSSLRLRNPANAAPDWVAAWLAEQGERPAAGVEGVAHIDTVGGVRVARVIAPIAVGAGCVVCHGPTETLAEPVRALLAERYPSDAATGYAAGDLRGAVWAEAVIR
ncbi:MAG: DUF3365 domain-containing protein [Myxococcota bacterium]